MIPIQHFIFRFQKFQINSIFFESNIILNSKTQNPFQLRSLLTRIYFLDLSLKCYIS